MNDVMLSQVCMSCEETSGSYKVNGRLLYTRSHYIFVKVMQIFSHQLGSVSHNPES